MTWHNPEYLQKIHCTLYIAVVVYFITNKVNDAETDLMGIAEKIFDMSGGDQTVETEKPKVNV